MQYSRKYVKQDGSYLAMYDLDKIPFQIKRIFYVSSEENESCVRGNHAHHECEQLLTCTSGKIKISYENKNESGTKFLYPGDSFYHGNMEWLTIEFLKEQSVLLSFCSREHDESDYIRKYDNFK